MNNSIDSELISIISTSSLDKKIGICEYNYGLDNNINNICSLINYLF